MKINLPRVRAGTPPSAKAEDLFRRGLEWLSRLRAGPGLVATRSGLARDVRPEMDVRLVGVSSPYSGREQVGTPGGGWADKAGGATVSAFELNAQTGLGGEVVHAELVGPDWRFAYNRIGSPTVPTCAPCDPAILPPTLYLSWTFVSGPYGATTTITPIELHQSGAVWQSGSINRNSGAHWFQFVCLSGREFLVHNFSWANGSYSICYPVESSSYSCSPFSADWTRTYTGEFEYYVSPTPAAVTICGTNGEFVDGVVNQDVHLILTA